MIFALKNLRFWGYVDSIIIKLAPLKAKKKGVTVFTKATKKTQDKIDLWIKDNACALEKMSWMCNKIVQLGFDAI